MMSNKNTFSHMQHINTNLNITTNDDDYSYEENRVKSYVSWQVHYPVDPIRLAKAGFYSTGNEDEVKCFSCKGQLKDWNYGDIVLKKHAELFPHCDFVNNKSNNVPLIQRKENKRNSNNLKDIVSNESTKLFQVFKSVDYNKMKSFHERIKSFTNGWPETGIDIKRIASAGFFYLGIEDKVQCPFCKGIVSNWEINDDPVQEHIKHFPWCEYFSKESSDSCSQDKTPWFQVGSEDLCGNEKTQLDTSSKSKLIDENQQHIDLKKLGVHIHKDPTHPQQASYAARLRSFSSWPSTSPVSKEDLAKAGFFYIGISDHTKCFHCNGGLCNWEDGDNPWFEHARWFRNCDFLLLNKGAAFIESCVQELPEDKMDIQETSTFIPSDNLLTKVDEAMRSKLVLQLLETDIFPSYLIRAAILRQLKETGAAFTNVDELCVAASYLKEQMESEPLKMSTYKSLDLDVNSIAIRTCTEEESDQNNLEVSDKTSKASKDHLTILSKVVDDNQNTSSDQCLCKICMDKEVGLVFLPCGHLIACTECAPALKSCPMCRKTIQATVRAYLP